MRDVGSGIGGLGLPKSGKAMPLEHLMDGFGVAFRKPHSFRVLIDDKNIAITVFAPEKNDGVMSESIIQGGEPLATGMLVALTLKQTGSSGQA